MDKLSINIITKNEENNIKECLESVKWADEIIVVDSFSTDKTVEIAKHYTDKVYQHEWPGYVEQDNRCLEYSNNDWILRLDADERVSPQLVQEIKKVLENSNGYSAFRIPRKNYFMGRFLKRPERHLIRLFKRDGSHWAGPRIHEHIVVKGETSKLTHPLIHFFTPDLNVWIDKLNRYTELSVVKQNRYWALFEMIFGAPYTFIREYFFYYRILDGIPGFIYSKIRSFYSFTKYAKRWEKASNKKINTYE